MQSIRLRRRGMLPQVTCSSRPRSIHSVFQQSSACIQGYWTPRWKLAAILIATSQTLMEHHNLPTQGRRPVIRTVYMAHHHQFPRRRSNSTILIMALLSILRPCRLFLISYLNPTQRLLTMERTAGSWRRYTQDQDIMPVLRDILDRVDPESINQRRMGVTIHTRPPDSDAQR